MSQNVVAAVRKSSDGQFYFRVEARNARVRVTSETYTRKQDAVRGAQGLILDIGGDEAQQYVEILDETDEEE